MQKNNEDTDLINHESFFEEKESSQFSNVNFQLQTTEFFISIGSAP